MQKKYNLTEKEIKEIRDTYWHTETNLKEYSKQKEIKIIDLAKIAGPLIVQCKSCKLKMKFKTRKTRKKRYDEICFLCKKIHEIEHSEHMLMYSLRELDQYIFIWGKEQYSKKGYQLLDEAIDNFKTNTTREIKKFHKVYK